jgi:hypothetical protein
MKHEDHIESHEHCGITNKYKEMLQYVVYYD